MFHTSTRHTGVFIFQNCFGFKIHHGLENSFCNISLLQENIKDKLRAIPVDVSVKILDGKRKRRQTQTSQLSPVLDANDVEATRKEVCLQKLIV